MVKKAWGICLPLLVAGGAIGGAILFAVKPGVKEGIIAGIVVALSQSFLSVGAMTWAWNKRFFYWVWGSGIFFRMFVFAVTAYVIYKFTRLNLVATLITLVSASTLFLVVESWAFLRRD